MACNYCGACGPVSNGALQREALWNHREIDLDEEMIHLLEEGLKHPTP